MERLCKFMIINAVVYAIHVSIFLALLPIVHIFNLNELHNIQTIILGIHSGVFTIILLIDMCIVALDAIKE